MDSKYATQSNLAGEGGLTTVSRTWESDRTSFRDIWVSTVERDATGIVAD